MHNQTYYTNGSPFKTSSYRYAVGEPNVETFPVDPDIPENGANGNGNGKAGNDLKKGMNSAWGKAGQAVVFMLLIIVAGVLMNSVSTWMKAKA